MPVTTTITAYECFRRRLPCNVGGYVVKSTKNEIKSAESLHKEILSPEPIPQINGG